MHAYATKQRCTLHCCMPHVVPHVASAPARPTLPPHAHDARGLRPGILVLAGSALQRPQGHPPVLTPLPSQLLCCSGPGAPHNSELARLGARTMLHMLIVDNLIHADLHPGNILGALGVLCRAAAAAAAATATAATAATAALCCAPCLSTSATWLPPALSCPHLTRSHAGPALWPPPERGCGGGQPRGRCAGL